MGKFTFDPRIFINPLYIECPNCKNNTFGILSIQEDRYFRRCKNCLYPRADEKSICTPLPNLKKKIIYIDQMAISNMMKALNPSRAASSYFSQKGWKVYSCDIASQESVDENIIPVVMDIRSA